MIAIPDLPPASAGEGSGRASVRPRYEDITQDGRVILTGFTTGLGPSTWRAMAETNTEAFASMRGSGILPILRRIVMIGEPGPFSVNVPIEYEGHWRLAREKGGDRLFLNMWMEARAPHGSTFAPDPPPDAPRRLVGRVFAEHVITRPFAPKEERKVTRLEIPGLPAIPERTHVFEEAEALVSGKTLADAGEIVFGVMHTDSNQHVNSLVYPRVFEEAVVRHVKKPELLARAVEICWRKPFFAGDTARLRLHVDGPFAVGTLSAKDAERASCTIAMKLA